MRVKVIGLWIVVLSLIVILSLFWNIGDMSEPLNQSILYQVRIPKVALALLAGIGLTIAGQLFQTLLNNPLADSFTLGLASGATFGSGLATVLGLSFVLIPVSSIAFSLITLALVLMLTTMMSRGYPSKTLILAGIMIGALFNAFLYVLIVFNQTRMNRIVNYMFGGFEAAEYNKVIYIALVLSGCLLLLALMIHKIKMLQLGDLSAQALGLNVRRLSYIVLIIASVMTAVIVGYVGIIGFIGMVVPQLIRRYYRQSKLGEQMILNGLIGGSIMVLVDWLGSTVIYPIQVPASIILALLGIPVLFYIMVTQSKTYD
ncbi:FecCD family ABC transporter permease [Staphylococcus auricularis]|uniref:FecCD family ABC transporter permease n=1 Tax=Staphylococcus auricularis TaxID=29379 RepID=UPI003F7ABCFC